MHEEYLWPWYANNDRSICWFCNILVSLDAISLVTPRKFQDPFHCRLHLVRKGRLCWTIWALWVAKDLGPLWQIGKILPAASPFDTLWLIMARINQGVGSLAAGTTNGSSFSRYSKGRRHYVLGTVTSCIITSVLIWLLGLITMSATQKFFREVCLEIAWSVNVNHRKRRRLIEGSHGCILSRRWLCLHLQCLRISLVTPLQGKLFWPKSSHNVLISVAARSLRSSQLR